MPVCLAPHLLILLILQSSAPHLLHDPSLSPDWALTPSQSNETTNLSAFLLQGEISSPYDRTRIAGTPNRWRSLVVEVGQLFQLFGSQEPEVKQRGWESRVDVTRCEPDQRCEWDCHLFDLFCERGVVLYAFGRHFDLFVGQF